MDCKHDRSHVISSRYEKGSGELVFFSACGTCGQRLSDVYRIDYRPQPKSPDAALPSGSRGAGQV